MDLRNGVCGIFFIFSLKMESLTKCEMKKRGIMEMGFGSLRSEKERERERDKGEEEVEFIFMDFWCEYREKRKRNMKFPT